MALLVKDGAFGNETELDNLGDLTTNATTIRVLEHDDTNDENEQCFLLIDLNSDKDEDDEYDDN